MVVTLQSFSHGDGDGGESDLDPVDFIDTPARFSDGGSSACSSPFVSAPSSPGRGSSPSSGCYFFSAPASPVHFVLYSAPATRSTESEFPKSELEFEFDFSSRLSSSSGGGGGGGCCPLSDGSMISADELFSNGQIKPMKLSSHLQRPQILSPLIDLEIEEEDGDFKEAKTKPAGEILNRRGRDLKLRSRSVHRKARSLSPLRNAAFQPEEDDTAREVKECIRKLQETKLVDDDENANANANANATQSSETTPSCSASSSRSSSSGRNSMKWIFLNNLLHRSKSEGRANGKEKFWSNISFSSSKIKSKEEKPSSSLPDTTVDSKPKKSPVTGAKKPTNGIAKRRGLKPSAHELHYTKNRAQAEEMKKRTYLPYRHGLFGCLGFSSKGYSALNGFTRSLNTVSSR